MPFVPLVALGSLVFCFMSFARSATNRNVNGMITQLVAWISGIVAVTLVAHTDYASGVAFGSKTLATLNGPGQIFIGLSASSLFGVVHQVKKALDPADSAAQPSLIPGNNGPVV